MPSIMDLEVGKPDGLGQIVLRLYSRKPATYCVYGVSRRVMVGYADPAEGDLAERQRRLLVELAPVRGEIDGLIDGWREGTNRAVFGVARSGMLRARAAGFSRRVADALAVALEGDVAHAAQVLAAIKQDILDLRVARARFEYLIGALLTALALMLGCWLVTLTYALVGDTTQMRRSVAVGGIVLLLALLAAAALFYARWRRADDPETHEPGADPDEARAPAATVGPRFWTSFWPSLFLFAGVALPVGAMLFVSLFVAANGRFYTPDYRDAVAMWRAAAAGSVGAFFSIAIGIRKRTVLPDLLRTSNLMDASLRVAIGFIGAGVLMALLRLGVVDVRIGNSLLNYGALTGVLSIGFLAGFSERLVPDLLEKAQANPTPPPRQPAPPPATAPPPVPVPTAAAAATAAADTPPADAHEDGCACDHMLADHEATRDEDLPIAAGGVAPAGEPAP